MITIYDDQVHTKRIWVMILFFMSFLFTPAFAKKNLESELNIINITDQTGKYSLGRYVRYYEDRFGELAIDDICSSVFKSKFVQSVENVLNFGFSQSTYWIHAHVHYTGKNTIPKTWLFEIAYPHIDYIEFYLIDHNGQKTVRKTGDQFTFNQRDINYHKFAFKLPINPNQKEYEFYIKVKSEGSVQLPLFLWSTEAFTEHVIFERFIFGLFFGTLLIMIIYNVFLLCIIRIDNTLFYLIFICVYFMFQLSLTGFGFQFFWFNYPWWANKSLPCFIMMAIVSSFYFAQNLLNLQKYAPGINKLISFFLSIALIFIPLTLFIQYKQSIFFSTLYAVIWSILMATAGIVSFMKGNNTARFFLLAWFLLLLGVFIYCLKSFGFIAANHFTEYAIQIGSFNLVMLLSIAMVDRVNIDRKEIAVKQQASIEYTKQLLQQQKQIYLTQARIASNIQEHADKTQMESNLIGDNLKSLTVQSDTVAATSEEISMSIVNISEAIQKMEQSVENVFVDTKKLFTNMHNVSKSIGTMSESMGVVESSARNGSIIARRAKELSVKTSQTMADLEIAANEIGMVTNVIKQISDKSNLLSLNTAVEAAAAGSAGKGFAVVSRFIQQFADKSTVAANNIELRIKDIQLKTKDTISVTNDVQEIIVNIDNTNTAIFDSIEKQVETANNITSKSIDIKKKSEKILSLIDHLVRHVKQISQNANEIAEGSNDVAKMMKHVSLALENCRQGIGHVSLSSKVLSELSNMLTGEHEK